MSGTPDASSEEPLQVAAAGVSTGLVMFLSSSQQRALKAFYLILSCAKH